MSRIRLAGLAAVVSLALPGTVRAQTFWDFVALNLTPAAEGAPRATYDAGRTVSAVGLGSVAFTAALKAGVPNSTALVVFDWMPSEKTPTDEKGVGACRRSDNPLDFPKPCYTSTIGEIGETPETEWLFMNLTGLNPGLLVQSITLASLQVGETYRFQVCTDNLFTTCSTYANAGAGPTNILTVPLVLADQSRRWVRLGAATPQKGSYLLQGITTLGAQGDVVTPEPGTLGLLATGLIALTGVGHLRRNRRR